MIQDYNAMTNDAAAAAAATTILLLHRLKQVSLDTHVLCVEAIAMIYISLFRSFTSPAH